MPMLKDEDLQIETSYRGRKDWSINRRESGGFCLTRALGNCLIRDSSRRYYLESVMVGDELE